MFVSPWAGTACIPWEGEGQVSLQPFSVAFLHTKQGVQDAAGLSGWCVRGCVGLLVENCMEVVEKSQAMDEVCGQELPFCLSALQVLELGIK